MDLISLWLKNNLAIYFFIYGLVFLFIGVGILYYTRRRLDFEPLKVKKYFYFAGASFLVLAFFLGIIWLKAGFLAVNWLNQDYFPFLAGIAVFVSCVFCIITVTWAIVNLFKVFDGETSKQLRDIFEQRGKVAEGIQEGIMLVDKDFKIIWINQSLKKRHGEKIVGDKCYRVVCKRAAPCETSQDACPLVEVLKENKPAQLIYTFLDADKRAKFIEASVYPLMDEKNQVVEFVHISRDITERKQKEEELKRAYVELHKVQVELMESEKLAAVGILASGIAHEIKNPLAVILQAVNFLEKRLKRRPKNVSEILDLIKDNIKRSDNIIQGILNFTRKSELSNQKKEDIKSIIESSLLLVQHKTRLGNIEIIREFQANLPEIIVERQKIEQALINILLNAIQAMPDGGRIFIRVYLKKLDELKNFVGRRKSDLFVLGEQALIVEIEDTGLGISKSNTDKLFMPFFTTKGPDKGVGLGLSVTRNIMLLHRGTIEIISQEGKFTKVVLTFKIGEERII